MTAIVAEKPLALSAHVSARSEASPRARRYD
jgi:hypothetical protein